MVLEQPQAGLKYAPFPPGTPLWDPAAACTCPYEPPIGPDGLPVGRDQDPAWTDWTEDPVDRHATSRKPCSCPCRRSVAHEVFKMATGLYGLGYRHTPDSKGAGDYPGWLDVDLYGPYGRPEREIKSMDGRLSEEQVLVLTSKRHAGHDVGVWRTCCLLSGEIGRQMAKAAGMHPQDQWANYRPPSARGIPLAGAPRRRLRPVVDEQLPGQPAEQFPTTHPAVGFEVPMSADTGARAQLEAWIRDQSFPPSMVPYPIRLVFDGALVAVQIRNGMARAGQPAPRCWRGQLQRTPLPPGLLERLGVQLREAGNAAALMDTFDREPTS